MAESKIKDENYYQISGFMINRLKLKGVPLNVYAIIYGFSQDGESEFTGNLQYLCDFCGGVSKPTIINALKTLTEAGYIIRREEHINSVTFPRYRVNLPLLKNFNGGSKEILTGAVKEFNGGSKETLPNNKTDISINNIDNKKESKRSGFDKIIVGYVKKFDNDTAVEIVDLLGEWLKVRKAKRAAMTDKAIQLNINKLDKTAKESGLTVAEYLQEVICRGWAAFYVIKNYGKKDDNKPSTNAAYNRDLVQQLLDRE